MAARKPRQSKSVKERNLVKAGVIFARVVDHANGKIEMSATQLKAADIVLSKTMPSLSNIEQSIVNEDDAKSLDQIKAELAALVQAQPEILTYLNSLAKPSIELISDRLDKKVA